MSIINIIQPSRLVNIFCIYTLLYIVFSIIYLVTQGIIYFFTPIAIKSFIWYHTSIVSISTFVACNWRMIMNEIILECTHLKKSLRRKEILRDINLDLSKGEIYGLIGENGAGKTTTLKIITGLLKADSGKISLLNTTSRLSIQRKQIGALIETPALFPDMTAYQNLKTICIQNGYNKQKILPTLQMVGLDIRNKTKVQHYSLGMKQRLGIAISIIGEPTFVILDEPLNGLDPTGILEFKNLIYKLNHEKGISFLISSHMLTELYQISTKFGFIQNGVTINQLTKNELASHLQTFTHLFTNDADNLKALIISKYPQLKSINIISPNELRLYDDNKELLSEIYNNFSKYISSIQYYTESLEDYYIRTITNSKKVGVL